MKFLRHASAVSNILVEKILAVLGITMAATVILQVFCRYILNHSLFWSEELARYLLVWLTFLGASCAYYRGVHPGIEILTLRLGYRLKKICRITVQLISICLFAVMIYYGITFAYFIRSQITPALAIPKWLIVSVIPISGALLLLHGIVSLASDLKEQNSDN